MTLTFCSTGLLARPHDQDAAQETVLDLGADAESKK